MTLGEVNRTGSPIVVLLEVTEAGMGKKLPVSWAVSWQGTFDGKGPPGNQDDFRVTGTKERQQVRERGKRIAGTQAQSSSSPESGSGKGEGTVLSPCLKTERQR